MRLSCNGCRVLRKGCGENCSIKPCLQWIKSPESQAHATVFLAKFYGRAGIINLIHAGPQHLRPEIFRSLLYDACGRIVNPIYGSVGLLSSGKWQLCQDAVEAVLRGDPITQIATESAEINNGPPILKTHDIRHVNKKDNCSNLNDIHRVRIQPKFKKSAVEKPKITCRECAGSVEEYRSGCGGTNRSTSHDSSSLSHQSEAVVSNVEGDNRDVEYLGCSVAVPAEIIRRKTAAVEEKEQIQEGNDIRLELTLGF